MARARKALRRVHAALAPLRNNPPFSPVLAETHREGWPRRVVERVAFLARVVRKEFDLLGVEEYSRVHQEFPGVGEESILQPVLRPKDVEAPQPARSPQRLQELCGELAGKAYSIVSARSKARAVSSSSESTPSLLLQRCSLVLLGPRTGQNLAKRLSSKKPMEADLTVNRRTRATQPS
eukprot:CAMPEP_0117549780 /NCGR_PEP_ID=MMETSP0784-20121206/48343_1 /TAXON_ID=39447 /ORGANISM="" /LENGTH=178 /DNA_ID=CAMNT_0005346781 /DNA_START=488 /DNA_END=1022 /DNA_ORIENTATION=-